MTFATGVIIANNYYAQPLEAAIAEAFHAPSAAVGAVLTHIQLCLRARARPVVPLGDLLERRRLVVTMLTMTGSARSVVALAPGARRARAAPRRRRADQRGRADPGAVRRAPRPRRRAGQDDLDGDVGPARRGAALPGGGGLVAELLGWRAVFVLGAVLTAVAARRAVARAAGAGTARPAALPRVAALGARPPARGAGAALADRLQRVVATRRSARCGRASASCWPRPPHSLSEGVIGLFSLFGVAGALAARFAGQARRPRPGALDGGRRPAADRAARSCSSGAGAVSLVALAIGLVVFDAGVQGTHISNQTIVYALRPEARSRLNSAYMTAYFLGGATGSGLSAAALRHPRLARACRVLGRRVPARAALAGGHRGRSTRSGVPAQPVERERRLRVQQLEDLPGHRRPRSGPPAAAPAP